MSPDGPIKLPPEEKLLKLIRGRGPKPAEPAVAVPGEGALAAAAVRPRTDPVGAWIRPRERRMAALPWFAMAAGGLGAVLALELVWLVMQAVRPLPTVEVPAGPAPSDAGPAAPSEPPALPSLVESVSRPLFAAAAKTGPAGAAQTPGPLSGTAQQLAQRLTLLGIVSGESPQAIIEDSQTKKTYFVTAGQTVADGAVVDKIQDTRVLLNLAGETIELML